MSKPSEGIALNPRFRDNEGALLCALLQATDEGVLLSGLDRQDIVANRRLGELFGMSSQEVVEADPGVATSRLRHVLRDPAEFEQLLQRTYADPELAYEDEIELLTEPPRTLRRFTGPVVGMDGATIGRLWSFLDITENKRLEAEVQAQLAARTEDYLATAEVLRALNDLCRTTLQPRTTDDLLLKIVEGVRTLVGYECAAVLLLSNDGKELRGMGAAVERAITPLHFPLRRDSALLEAVEGNLSSQTAPLKLYLDHDGPITRRLRCRTVGIAPLIGENRVVGVLVMGTRDPKPHEDRYRIAHLRALVDQIALTLETHRLQAELQSAMESLKTAQQRIVEIEKLRTAGTLAASVAHDIRNILTAMQMEMAAEPTLASDSLCDQINRFAALTHRLLAFSRPNVLETRSTSLVEVIERIVELVSAQAEIANVQIITKLPKSRPLVSADATQLEHLFVNLCLNAIQAMNERGGRLTLTVRADHNWTEVQVQDTGRGIEPTALERIFEPFFTTRATGFGLGLFSCKRIVEEHGGQLQVASVPGQGACFTVMLPVAA